MLRSSRKLFNNVVSVGSLELDCNIQRNVIQQFVRWRLRKPVHLGTAKTKLYRVPERPVLSESETEELKHLHYNYKTLMRSIYAFLKEENLKLADGSKQLLEEEAKENALFAKCMEENDRWNEECAKVRNVRIVEDKLVKEVYILQKQRISQIKKDKETLKWEARVGEQVILSKDFISEDQLDEAVRKAMETVADFNFAITLKGQIIMGADPLPDQSIELNEKIESSESAKASV